MASIHLISTSQDSLHEVWEKLPFICCYLVNTGKVTSFAKAYVSWVHNTPFSAIGLA